MQTARVLIDGQVRHIPYDTIQVGSADIFADDFPNSNSPIQQTPVLNLHGYRIEPAALGNQDYDWVAFKVSKD